MWCLVHGKNSSSVTGLYLTYALPPLWQEKMPPGIDKCAMQYKRIWFRTTEFYKGVYKLANWFYENQNFPWLFFKKIIAFIFIYQLV